ncbi:alkaline phosphatase [Pirellulales bacterium]|nr:alkaline phosphatase [Pirellulales bacterium]
MTTRLFTLTCLILAFGMLVAEPPARADHLQELQAGAIAHNRSAAVHWGWEPDNYVQWGTHTNRLIPLYTFGTKGAGSGIDLREYTGAKSIYRNEAALLRLYGRPPQKTLNTGAEYCDQTDVFRIQQAALGTERKHIVLVVFDGMDWQTTRAAAIYNSRAVTYCEGRGQGTHFQDYEAAGTSQFGCMVTAPHSSGADVDVDTQKVIHTRHPFGGYDAARGGPYAWSAPIGDPRYPAGQSEPAEQRHPYTDSAASATSMTAGIKTFNGSINVTADGHLATTIAHVAQLKGYAIGAVSSVPFSHATPAAAYAHNVSRNDYQDLSRDMLGLASVRHLENPLPGMDVVIGGGHGCRRDQDAGAQGQNFEPGNEFLADEDLARVNVANGGKYVVAVRAAGVDGDQALTTAAKQATSEGRRLLGFYGLGSAKGHLPYQTADGDYEPTAGRMKSAEKYSEADVRENPTLAGMTRAALEVLSQKEKGFWLMVEAGDVDWSNHDNNLDNSIGAVNSGDEAVRVITDWVEQNSNWQESVLIVTADHGHYLVLEKPEILVEPE